MASSTQLGLGTRILAWSLRQRGISRIANFAANQTGRLMTSRIGGKIKKTEYDLYEGRVQALCYNAHLEIMPKTEAERAEVEALQSGIRDRKNSYRRSLQWRSTYKELRKKNPNIKGTRKAIISAIKLGCSDQDINYIIGSLISQIKSGRKAALKALPATLEAAVDIGLSHQTTIILIEKVINSNQGTIAGAAVLFKRFLPQVLKAADLAARNAGLSRKTRIGFFAYIITSYNIDRPWQIIKSLPDAFKAASQKMDSDKIADFFIGIISILNRYKNESSALAAAFDALPAVFEKVDQNEIINFYTKIMGINTIENGLAQAAFAALPSAFECGLTHEEIYSLYDKMIMIIGTHNDLRLTFAALPNVFGIAKSKQIPPDQVAEQITNESRANPWRTGEKLITLFDNFEVVMAA